MLKYYTVGNLADPEEFVTGRADSSKGQTTPTQRRLADAVCRELEQAHARYEESMKCNNAECWIVIKILTPPGSGLDVSVFVVGDTMLFTANGADFYVDHAAFQFDDDAWITGATDVIARLLQSELRIRLRKTLFHGVRGAVWLPGNGDGGAWSGDLVAVRGKGVEVKFPVPWYDVINADTTVQ